MGLPARAHDGSPRHLDPNRAHCEHGGAAFLCPEFSNEFRRSSEHGRHWFAFAVARLDEHDASRASDGTPIPLSPAELVVRQLARPGDDPDVLDGDRTGEPGRLSWPAG